MPDTSKSLHECIFNAIHSPHIYLYRDYQIWDLGLWQCLKSLEVPAYINNDQKRYIPITNINNGLILDSVRYIKSNSECLVLSYENLLGLESIGGLLMFKNYELKLWYDEDMLQNNFHPFPSFMNSLHDLTTLDDQQFISMTKIVSR